MKMLTYFALFTLLFVALAARAQCPLVPGSACYFYGGDIFFGDPNQNGLANENDVTFPAPVLDPYVGAATYQNFEMVSPTGIVVMRWPLTI